MTECKTLQERMLVKGSERLRSMVGHEPTFPPATLPGLYPIVYVDEWDNYLCGTCAEARLVEAEGYDDLDEYVCWREDQACDAFVYYAGSPIWCEGCDKEIESAYGDPWEDED